MLSDTQIRSAKASTKPYKLHDERGLYLLVQPNGAHWWRFKYRFAGKERLLSLGVYPDVQLKRARERRDEARALVANQVDPSQHRQAVHAELATAHANTFRGHRDRVAAEARASLGARSR